MKLFEKLMRDVSNHFNIVNILDYYSLNFLRMRRRKKLRKMGVIIGTEFQNCGLSHLIEDDWLLYSKMSATL